MNYYPFHIGDYASATRHLSWNEDAAFRRLLDIYYTSEKPIPLDERQVFRLLLAQTDDQREAVRVVLAEFFEKTEEGWRNKRADAELVVMQEKQQKQRDKANKRWQKQREEHGTAKAMPQNAEADAAASKARADAMPPTPTPTPTPTPKKEKKARASAHPPCPDGVDGQVWSDWLELRKAKRAPVTETVLQSAKDEAESAGMSLEAFLRVWCRRGSQGLEASWLKPNERSGPTRDDEPEWRRLQRERNEAFLGPAAARRTTPAGTTGVAEIIDVTSRLVG